MTDTILKFSNMPEGLDSDLIKKRDSLIFEGKKEFREIITENDMSKPEVERRIRPILAAKKGAYSRKFYQYAKELFIVDLFQRNYIPMTFKNFDVVSEKIFGQSLDKTVIANMEKDSKYGKGVQSPIVIENEVLVIDKLRVAIKFMITPYREEVLANLAYDKINEDYEPEKVKSSKRPKL